MYNILFSIIENSWFIDLIKTLQLEYDSPSRQVLSGILLEPKISHVNICIINELSADNNFTIAIDEHLSNVIEEIINKVGAVAIVSDNSLNIAAAHKIITNNYPNIINMQCITHCVNLINIFIGEKLIFQ
ncbi:hypothetical protein RhiirA4_481013 [Rhizophagus irregularis]|uniref:Uncharacterized protein n=1 Tax=Rhizophagus irregularis TaxID=588596 RepID=A0A2I1HIX6_9GLOM|nr:hypothetical protein RhiirA4_481013 [Rhizophagus irregularis]